MIRQRRVRHPGGMPVQRTTAHGVGGPTLAAQAPLGPAVPANPIAPGSPAANAAGSAASAATKAIGDALGSGLQAASKNLLAAGEVLLGVVLLVAGLLLATGLAGKGAALGRRAASLTPQGRGLGLR